MCRFWQALPGVHGMVGNVWYDRSEERLVYNVEDGNYKMLTSGAVSTKQPRSTQLQKTAQGDGRSPRAYTCYHTGDELMISNNGKSKVFGVSR